MREPLDVSAVRATAGRFWPQITVVEQTASTNDDLAADRTASDHTVLVTEHQAAGHGRLGRTWESTPRSGLTFSFLVRPAVPVLRWAWLPLLAGVALREAVVAQVGVAASLKWPNDLLVVDPDGMHRKSAGILAQTVGDAVVVGIGLNVSSTREELPVDTASSVELAAGHEVDRTALLSALLIAIERRYASWQDADGDAERSGLAAAYLDACETVGRRVRISGVDGSEQLGIAIGVDRAGRLQVDTDRGPVVVSAGDVEHVRDADVG